MNFDKINLHPDSGNDFSENSQDTESGQVDFGPFRVDISPPPADTHLSQAGSASTEADQDDYTFRFENVDTVSSDEDVSHLKVAPALTANTGKVFEQNKKIPVKLVNEIKELLKNDQTSTELSELEKDKNSLASLLKPREVKDKKNRKYSKIIGLEDVKIRGVLLTDIMKEYSVNPNTKREIKTVYSYSNWQQDSIEIFLAFGILKSGEPFKFEESWNFSSLYFAIPSRITIAPDWGRLIDNLEDRCLEEFVENMSKSNSTLLTDWLEIQSAANLTDLRDKLKIVLDPDLLDKFCQQVINK